MPLITPWLAISIRVGMPSGESTSSFFSACCRAVSSASHRNGLRSVGSSRQPSVSGSLNGLWPSVIDSRRTFMFWIELAWLTERQIVFSAEVSALSRPSGLPTASSAPRTTRCVWRWTRWSVGFAEATLIEAIE